MAFNYREVVCSLSLTPHTPITLTHVQWNPSITDTIGNQHYVHYSGVSLTQGLPVYFQ